jgi:hypothetical protein
MGGGNNGNGERLINMDIGSIYDWIKEIAGFAGCNYRKRRDRSRMVGGRRQDGWRQGQNGWRQGVMVGGRGRMVGGRGRMVGGRGRMVRGRGQDGWRQGQDG